MAPDLALFDLPLPVWRPPDRPGRIGGWVVAPPEPASAAVPLVAVHGIGRKAREVAGTFRRTALGQRRPLVAPLFDRQAWPRYQRAIDPARADLALLDLLDELVAHGRLPAADSFELLGFSGGAQFAHRFAMRHPRRVRRLHLVAAGWYTFPDRAPFPYGLGGALGAALAAALYDFLAIPMHVLVGAGDTERDATLRSGPAIDRQQGRHRVERAVRWSTACRAAARARGIEADIRLELLGGCGHDLAACAHAGLAAGLLGAPPGGPAAAPPLGHAGGGGPITTTVGHACGMPFDSLSRQSVPPPSCGGVA
jgi:pimeloyl-ACP methyl ester carboxylesterase